MSYNIGGFNNLKFGQAENDEIYLYVDFEEELIFETIVSQEQYLEVEFKEELFIDVILRKKTEPEGDVSPFNRTKFNTGISDSEFWLEVEFKESLIFEVIQSDFYELEANFHDELFTRSIMSIAQNLEVDFKEELLFNANFDKFVYLSTSFHDELFTSSRMEKDVHLMADFVEELSFNSFVGKEVYLKTEFEEELFIEAWVGKVVILDVEYVDILDIYSAISLIDEQNAFLNIVIPPGGKLEIDSEHFTVYLNATNVFDKYSGDWIEVKGDSTLTISGIGAQELTGKILYTELYL